MLGPVKNKQHGTGEAGQKEIKIGWKDTIEKRGEFLLFELIVQAFLGAVAIFFSIPLLRSGKYWKIALGIVLMAAGVLFTFSSGDILMSITGLISESLNVKQILAPFFPYVIGAAFVAWLCYVSIAFLSRLNMLGTLWAAFKSKPAKAEDYLETAKRNALRDQFFWLVFSFTSALVALVIISVAWLNQSLFQSSMELMVVAMVWVFVVPPMIIHTAMKKPREILALKEMKNLQSIKSEKISDYRELMAVMDEIKDEDLKKRLDEVIIDGLSEALTE